jgi:spore coat polysaccharide biosynthesis protein SpsF
MNIAIIIQARLGSTRLPNKILLDFHNGKCILEILYERLALNNGYKTIIATTVNPNDDILFDFCKKREMDFFRGSEDDVLARFIDTAKRFDITHVIRVCSDNPFIFVKDLNMLNETLLQYPNTDYISFKIREIPSILTHYGFWAELVSLQALCVAAESNDNKTKEHVTNYIYKNADKFNIKWLKTSEVIEKNMNIRLTVDTADDFINAQFIYKITGELFDPESIIEIINKTPEVKNRMLTQIGENKK